MARKPVIEFSNFTFRYDAQVNPTLCNINLTVFQGEKLLIAGASGSGKSTLAYCINGLIPFCYGGEITGSVKIFGQETRRTGVFQLSKSVGTVLQDTDGQFIGLTVGEDIAFALENDCVPRVDMLERARQAAEQVHMEQLLFASPQELSGGQKQKVSLAGVIVDNVSILLFDEPLANLDPAAGKHAIELIEQTRQQTSATIIIIEHRLEDALYCGADRIILLEEGRITADLPPDRLLAGGLLPKAGIREPLYVTALKYAGCTITEQMHPRNIKSLTLDENRRQKVRDWVSKKPAPVNVMRPEPLLTVKNLSFGYTPEETVLRDVSFVVRKGEMLSVVGENGAGKSTLSKLICGFEKQRHGSICLGGEPLEGRTIKERARHIGYVMQNPNQMISKPMLFDEVALSLCAQKLHPDEIKERVYRVLKICGIYEYRNWPVAALSFGQKKRATIAGVLVQEPEIIILDEPTAGQDLRHYTEIMDFLCELNQQGVTVLLVTHDMHLMLEYTPRALVFSGGRLIADTTAIAALTDGNLISRANLKRTSLFELAEKCEVNPAGLIEKFVSEDRREREYGWSSNSFI